MQRRFHSSYRAVTLTGARQWTEAGRRGRGHRLPGKIGPGHTVTGCRCALLPQKALSSLVTFVLMVRTPRCSASSRVHIDGCTNPVSIGLTGDSTCVGRIGSQAGRWICSIGVPHLRHQPYCSNGQYDLWVVERRAIGQGRMSLPPWLDILPMSVPRSAQPPRVPGRGVGLPSVLLGPRRLKNKSLTLQAASRTRPEKGIRRSRCRRMSLVYLRGVPRGIRTPVLGLKGRRPRPD